MLVSRLRCPATIIVVGYLAHVAWRLWLIRNCNAPTAHADEDDYLLAARALAGGAGGYSTENDLFRRIGYPLLLAPVYWVTTDPFRVYRVAQIVGVLINSLMFPLAAMFASRVLGIRRLPAIGLGFVAAALPSLVFYTGMVMTDVVLPVLMLAWLLLIYESALATRGAKSWALLLGSGAVAGLTAIVHIRGVMVLIVHVTGLAVLALSRRVRPLVAACSLLVALAVAAGDILLKWVLGDAIILIGNDPSSQIATATTVDWGVTLVLFRVVGQFWYLAIGTLGFGAAGLVAVLTGGAFVGKDADSRFAKKCVLLGLLAVSVLVVAGSAASLPFGDRRITYFDYPRYLHPLFPVWFMVGFAAVVAVRSRGAVLLLARTASCVAVMTAIVQWRTSRARGYWFLAFDAPEPTSLGWQWQRLEIVVPTVVAMVLFFLVVLSQRWRRTAAVGLAGVLVLCGVTAQASQRNIIAPMVGGQYTAATPRLVRDLGLGSRDVVAETWQVRFPVLYNHMREVTWQRLLIFDGHQPPPAEATVIIAPWYGAGAPASWDGTTLGMSRIGGDTQYNWAVWRRS